MKTTQCSYLRIFRQFLPKETNVAQIIKILRENVAVGKMQTLMIMDNRGKMLTPSTRIDELELEYGEMVFVKYCDMSYFG